MDSMIDKNSIEYQESKRKYLQIIAENKEWLHNDYVCTAEQIKTRIKELILNPQSNENLVAGLKDGKLRLYKKVSPNMIMEILTVEDAFDTILSAHIQSSHGDADTTYKAMSNTHSVLMFCVNAVIDSCSSCAKSADEQRRGVWRMNIVKVNPRLPTSTYNKASYLLIMKEEATNFIILRSLYPSLQEVAFELMKIFVEFNYPKKIVVADNLQTYKQLMVLVRAINPGPKMPEILQSSKKEIFEADKTEVLNEIEDWATMENGLHWDQYCHMVQYKMNTEKKDLTRLDPKYKVNGVPFKLFFKYEPHSLMEWVPKSAGNLTET
ncbi:uncharacterized protein LOC126911398 [Spodoptera frugiperda]|uniref:Uncharacterized protein LOC126911398 n=1 Tax=Spodoptera frugiperda TaxID=7108 RepID=A0A9R0DX53_SPOFR|nr:uncharacterized protein LOC126911398 [Spodoptera frugiperda]